jgi:hypothetical protein
MKAYKDEAVKVSSIRAHPWTENEFNLEEKYYDFKAHPELIPQVLEKFRDWAKYDGVQLFYDLLRWLNGPDSRLESNDCRFRPPGNNSQKDTWPKELVCSGDLLVFFRNLKFNLSDKSTEWATQRIIPGSALPPLPPGKYIDWLQHRSFHYIQRLNAGFKWSCVALLLFPTVYTELPLEHNDKFGHGVVFKWWAWGDTEEETMNNFKEVIATMFECLKLVSEEIGQGGG